MISNLRFAALSCCDDLIFKARVLGLAAVLVLAMVVLVASSDSELSVAVVAGSVTIAGSIGGGALSRFSANERAREDERRSKKIPVYESFVSFFIKRVLYATKLSEKPVQLKELHKFFAEFTTQIMIWGSDEVIQSWVEARESMNKMDDATPLPARNAAFLSFEKVLFAMRRDIGYPESRLEEGAIFGLFVNDIKSVLDEQNLGAG